MDNTLSDVSFSFAYRTNQGSVREKNEDRLLAEAWPDGTALLAVIADGMGGHGGGDVAAETVIETFRVLLNTPLPRNRKECYELLLERFYAAESAIKDRSQTDFALLGMGATVIAAIVTQGELLHLHAGDSRLYHFDWRNEPYVTTDHSVIQVLLETGHITPDQVTQHPMRSVVTSCIGGGEGKLCVHPKWDEEHAGGPAFRSLTAGDVLLLSSDGFHGQVDEAVPALLADEYRADTQKLVDEAVAAALEAGGGDNVSVIAISMTGTVEHKHEELLHEAVDQRLDLNIIDLHDHTGQPEPLESPTDDISATNEQPATPSAYDEDIEDPVKTRSFLSKLLHWKSKR